MNRHIRKLWVYTGIISIALFLGVPRIVLAAPVWTSAVAVTEVDMGQTGSVTVSASGGSATKITCQNCTPGGAIVKDNGDGTALVTWDTSSTTLSPGTYYISVKATDTGTQTSVTGSVGFKLVKAAGTSGPPQWTSNVSGVTIEIGKTGSAAISASGGTNTKFECPGCNSEMSISDHNDGTATISWNTVNTSYKVGGYSITIKAINKLDGQFSNGSINFNLVQQTAEGLPNWTSSVPMTVVEPGKKVSVTVSATGGANTAITCLNCTEVFVVDNKDGTATVTWDATNNTNKAPGQYNINLRATNLLNNKTQDTTIWFNVVGETNAGSSSGNTDQSASQSSSSDYEICSKYKATECAKDARCFVFNNTCYAKSDMTMCSALSQKLCGSKEGATQCSWNTDLGHCQNPTQAAIYKEYGEPDNYQGFMPKCAWSGDCRDTNDLLQLAINFTKFLFGFIGSVAFVMFVYGGFIIILSMGNSEKVNQGKQILTAAVVGLIIAFGAYVLVDFLLDAFQTNQAFREIGK